MDVVDRQDAPVVAGLPTEPPLSRLLAAGQVVTDPVALLTYEVDAGLDRGRPDGVVFPHTADDVVRIVRWADEHGVPLIARGAGTGLSGGTVASRGGLIVEFSRMNRVLELDEAGRSARVQPGVINQVLDEVARAKGLYYPPDPASGRASTLGGNVAENSGGPHCFKYGVTTNYVTGLQVVLADGRLVQLGGRALDYPEYDLIGLVTGSEGTLGIVTEASVRLVRDPPAVKTLMAAFDSVEQAGQAVSAVIARGLVPATMEMMDQKIVQIIEDFAHAGLPTEAGAVLIMEADGYPESLSPQVEEMAAIMRECHALDLRIAQTAEERDKIWYARKSAAGAMARLAPAYYLVDGTVPRSRLAQVLAAINHICDAHELQVGYVFHAGDGNLHPLILIEDPTDEAFMKRVYAAGHEMMVLCVREDGSITGEHGVGLEKRDYMPLMYSADELRTMQDVKEVFDPQHLLNPGKVLPADSARRPSSESIPGKTEGPPPASPFAPGSAQEAAEAVCAWSAAGQRIRIRGGGTKSGGLPPADVLLSTQALRGIQTYARDDLYVTAGAGTPLAELQAELAPDRMWTPLVSPWPAATIGGLVATSFNAPLRMRYGGVRDLVLAATIAMADGRVIRAGRPVVKNVAGYDLPKLFVGSHGTLGLIADVTLRLVPLPRARASLIAPVDDLARGLAWGTRLLGLSLVASALLLCRGRDVPDVSAPYVLIHTAEGLPEDVAMELAQARSALQAGGAAGLIQIDAPSGNDVWARWLNTAPSTDTLLRLGVAPRDLPGILRDLVPALGEAPFVADLANGMLYTRRVSDVEALRRPAHEAGGYAVVLAAPPASRDTFDAWGHTPDSLDLMRALKARWDTRGLLNPGAFVV